MVVEEKNIQLVRIHIENKDGTTQDFMVMLIAQIQSDKIYRLSEVTYPGW